MTWRRRTGNVRTAPSNNFRAGAPGALLALLLLLALLPATALGANVSSWPYQQNFNTASGYSDLVQLDPSILRFTHQATGGWNNSGCAKFTFLQQSGESGTGLGFWSLPTSGTQATKRINVRWLVYYGTGYAASKTQETKSLIVERCNETACTSGVVSGRRGILLESGGGSATPYPCWNIECTGSEPQQPGMPFFDIRNYQGQWISMEAEWDTTTGDTKIYIDTQDGVFQSRGGTTPYKAYRNTSQANSMNWATVSYLMGYWEATRSITANSYFMMDELVIHRTYIGPPAGFGSGAPPPPPPPPPPTDPAPGKIPLPPSGIGIQG
jgi:hypothetical protein